MQPKLLKVSDFRALVKKHGGAYKKDSDGNHSLTLDNVTEKAAPYNSFSYSTTNWQVRLADKLALAKRESKVIMAFRDELMNANRAYLEF